MTTQTEISDGVVMASDAYRDMVDAGASALPKETGGVLLGFRSASSVVVTRVLPVPDDASTGVSFRLSVACAQKAVDGVRPGAARPIGFVGDWHVHPADVPPSATDVDSLTATARDSDEVITLVVLPFDGSQPRPVHALVVQGARRRLVRRRQPKVRRADFQVSHLTGAELERLAERSLQRNEEDQ